MQSQSHDCRVCGSNTEVVGRVRGRLSLDFYSIARCRTCNFAFIENPRTDYDVLYSEDYYKGKGADPYVDYLTELESPEITVRFYEWRGIISVVNRLTGTLRGLRWLDYGCGNGGLVRAGRAVGIDIHGFENGWIADRARSKGIPVFRPEELDRLVGQFDIVSAIEVLEHAIDPVALLKQINTLLKRGGLFFATTGNARPFRSNLTDWLYTSVPEVHVSFFEPNTLAEALHRAGFRVDWPGYVSGFSDIIRFKVLKNLGVRSRSSLEMAVPWAVASRIVDKRYGVSEHPIGHSI
jgi:2-polyprenyl-3-methyl-5-hydroxy-6-metoxy-1,4-benzoquinol methylase